MQSEPPKDDPPKRRWFQFRLRTLMIVVTVVAVACGTIALAEPPLVVGGYLEGVYPFRVPNPYLWFATLVELLAVNFWYARRERRK